MGMRVTDLRCKEVVCINDGCRLGFVSDVEVEVPEGRICAIIVPGRCKFFGMFCRQDDFVIPWRNICRFGDDIILVDCHPESCRVPRNKPGWFK